MTIKNILFASMVACLVIGSTSCRSEKTVVNNERSNRQGPNGQRRTPAEIIAQMDTNKDGQISAAEARGPMKDNFSMIDTNNNGLISLAELKAAPRPPRNGQRGGARGGQMRQ